MNWIISQLERALPGGVVFVAHWRVTKVEDDCSGTAYGTQSFESKDPADPTFVPYDELTEAQVVDWVKAAMGDVRVAEIEANVQAQIDSQKNPTQASGMPWAA